MFFVWLFIISAFFICLVLSNALFFFFCVNNMIERCKFFLRTNGIILSKKFKQSIWLEDVVEVNEYPNGLVENIIDNEHVFYTLNGKLLTELGENKFLKEKDGFFVIVGKFSILQLKYVNHSSIVKLNSNWVYMPKNYIVAWTYNIAGDIENTEYKLLDNDIID